MALDVAVMFALLLFSPAAPSAAQAKPIAPDVLVKNLYRDHDHKRSPFFQTKSRALVNKYFEKTLADLIWKDATTVKNEVGALDGDPLYDAQDMEIKNFKIAPAKQDGNNATVLVTFDNLGRHTRINYRLTKTRAGWRISDIEYDGYTLRGLLKGSG